METTPYSYRTDENPFSFSYKKLLANEINEKFKEFEIDLYIKQPNTKQHFVNRIPATDKTYEIDQYATEILGGCYYGSYPCKAKKTKLKVSAKVVALYVLNAEIEISFYNYTGKFQTNLNVSTSPNEVFNSILDKSEDLVNKILIKNKEFEFIDKQHEIHYNKLIGYEKSIFNIHYRNGSLNEKI